MAKYLFTNKKEFKKYFVAEILPAIRERYEQDGRVDYPARREEWNNLVDAMAQDGEIPPRGADWVCPW